MAHRILSHAEQLSNCGSSRDYNNLDEHKPEGMSALITASPWLGGSGTLAFRLGEALSRREGFTVRYTSYETPYKATPDSQMTLHQVEPYSYPLFPFGLSELALAENLVELSLKHGVDIINAHYGITFGNAAMLAKTILDSRGHTAKTVVSFHGSDVLGFDLDNPGTVAPFHTNKWTAEAADAVTVPSESLANMLRDIYNIRRPISVIPNFIDTKEYNGINLSDRTDQPPTIIHISNFRKVKNAQTVARIFEKVKLRIPDARLELIGDGPDRSKLEEFFDERNIRDVHFHGVIKDERGIVKRLQQAHAILVPSTYESFSLVALEAQACGVPVIASNRGGLPEVVQHGETGYLSDLENVDEMAENTIYLLQNMALWKEIGSKAITNAKRFDTQKVIPRYIDLYNSLLST